MYASVCREIEGGSGRKGDYTTQLESGFRKEMGMIDNIYVLNYLIQDRVEKKGEIMVRFLVDLKAAFDSVDRGY